MQRFPSLPSLGCLVGALYACSQVTLPAATTSLPQRAGIAFALPAPEPTVDGRWRVAFPADAEAYFVLYQGAQVTRIDAPQSLALGSAASRWLAAPGRTNAAFFRAARVPLATPLDLDGDGIDDVFELRYPTALNPLDPRDATQDADADGRTNLEEYRVGTDPTGGMVGWTVRIVDTPAPASRVEFRTLAEAIEFLNASMPPTETGRVILATERPQDIVALNLTGQVEFEVAPNFAGKAVLRGPGAQPLVIQAAQGLALTGWNVQNTGGIQILAGRRLALHRTQLPATVLRVNGTGSQQALSSKPRLASGGPSVAVGNSVFSGPLRLEWSGGASAGATLGITDNSAPTIQTTVSGAFAGQASIQGNLTADLALQFDALAAAQVVVGDMQNLQSLTFRGSCTGNPTLQFQNLIASSVQLQFAGIGSVFTSLSMLQSKTLTLDVGAAETDIDSHDIQAEQIVMHLTSPGAGPPKLRLRQRQATATGGIRINAWDAEHGELDLTLAVVNAASLELSTRAATTLKLQDQVQIQGRLQATVQTDVLNFEAYGARVDAGIDIKAQGLGAGIQGFWQGGTIRGNTDIEVAYGVSVGLTIDGAIFEAGGLLSIMPGGEESLPSPETVPPCPAPSRRGLHGSDPGKAILLRNLSEAPGTLQITDTDSSVTLEKCTIQGAGFLPSVMLQSVRGPIEIKECQILGPGIAISEAEGAVSITDLTLQPGRSLFPALGIDSASASLTRLVVQGGLSGLALKLTGAGTLEDCQFLGGPSVTVNVGTLAMAKVTLDGTFTADHGQIHATQSRFGPSINLLGDARMHFANLSLGGTFLLDFNPNGGLLVDPTTLGANPEEVFSSIDFDRDQQGCADYPPPQYREDTGACVREGVPPP